MMELTSYTPPPTAPVSETRDLVHGFLSDTVWAGISSGNYNLLWQSSAALDPSSSISGQITNNAFIGPMAAQWLYASVPMLILAIGETIARKARGEKLTTENWGEIWSPAISASMAIPMWDLGQTIGAHIGATTTNSATWYGSSIAAGMVAAPLAGVFSGFTACSVQYLVDVLTNPITREMWRQNPTHMGKLLTKELVLNSTIGAIPGAIWQILFFFITPALIAAVANPIGGVILAVILIALAVMLTNYLWAPVVNKISNAFDKAMGWDEETHRLEERARLALEQAQHLEDNCIELQPLRCSQSDPSFNRRDIVGHQQRPSIEDSRSA